MEVAGYAEAAGAAELKQDSAEVTLTGPASWVLARLYFNATEIEFEWQAAMRQMQLDIDAKVADAAKAHAQEIATLKESAKSRADATASRERTKVVLETYANALLLSSHTCSIICSPHNLPYQPPFLRHPHHT